MLINIIVPYHGEPYEVYKNLFDSINEQNIDFKNISIYIARSDGLPNMPDLSFWSNLKDRVTYISSTCPASAPGPSRQLALDTLISYYQYNEIDPDKDGVMFCDCDDKFYTNDTLSTLLTYINYNPDYTKLQCRAKTINHEKTEDVSPFTSAFVMWGAVYRLKDIIDYNIKIPLDMNCQEDFFFNDCIFAIPKFKIYQFTLPVYYWCRRDDSTTTIQLKPGYRETLLKSLIIYYKAFKDWKSKYCSNSVYFGAYVRIGEVLSTNLPHAIHNETYDEALNVIKDIQQISSQYNNELSKLNHICETSIKSFLEGS